MGFVFIRKAILDACAGRSQSLAMDLYDQHVYMEKTTQSRFTPPTHVVVALAEAIAQFEEEGGQPARLARYTSNYNTLIQGMARLGLDRKSTRLNSSHVRISYAVFCLKKKKPTTYINIISTC